MSHPLVLAVFDAPPTAAAAARALHGLGVPREDLSIVARSHDEEGALARELGGTPGADIEDSRLAARLGELSGYVLAMIAVVTPGVGSLVTAGPLAAGLGEAAGHVAGGVAHVLKGAGVAEERAATLERMVKGGAILVGVHVRHVSVEQVQELLSVRGARNLELARWED
jgi:hypothetical protein